MFSFAWFRRATRSTVWSASFLFLFPLLLATSIPFDPVRVTDINPNGDAFPDYLTPAGDSVYFYADTGQGRQFFVADESGATQLTSLPDGTGCIWVEASGWPIIVSDAVYFGVTDGNSCGIEQVWRSDGTPGGTQLVKGFSGVTSIHAASKGFFALGSAGNNESGIWYSDGTTAGTRLVQRMINYSSDSPLGVLDDQFYMVAWNPIDYYNEFWRADPDSATLLSTTLQGNYLTGAVYQNTLYIASSNGEVWRLPAGSDTPVLWEDGGKFYGRISRMVTAGDRLYLIDWDTSRPMIEWTETLWRYDGAADKLDEIATYSQIRSLAAMGDSVYFAANQWAAPPQGGSLLLRLPLADTTPVAVSPQLAIGSDRSIDRMVTDGEFVYMRVFLANGVDVWASDGSAAGTQRVAGMTSNYEYQNAAVCPCLDVAGGRLYFDRQDEATGSELWTLDRVSDNPLYLPHLVR